MKFIFISCIVICLFISCSKEKQRIATNLIGKWKAIEHFQSPGAGGNWYKLSNADQFTIEFKADGSFAYSSNFPKAAQSFNQYDTLNNIISITATGNTNKETWYYMLEDGHTLNLSIYTCIERCPYRLKAIK